MMARLLLGLIGLYRQYLSGLKKAPTCRFIPTCSEYAAQAIQRHGALRGGALALWRVLRCNPFGKWGFDPVPQTLYGPLTALRRKTAERRQRQRDKRVD